jgi:hypothetical protein
MEASAKTAEAISVTMPKKSKSIRIKAAHNLTHL